MLQIERQQKVLEYIQKKKIASIEELSNVFKVSKVTIRRDLKHLSENNVIVKTHGGASSNGIPLSQEIPYSQKMDTFSHEKALVGKEAAKLINDHDIVIIDAGSTTYEVAKNITQNDITILTNDLRIGMLTAETGNANLYMSGGKLSNDVYTLIGEQTSNFFKKHHVNKTFLGCDALDLSYGITNRTDEEVSIKQDMIKAADQVIMVTDSSKLNKRVFSFLCNINEIDVLIIDKIKNEDKIELEILGVEVIVAQNDSEENRKKDRI